MKRCFLVLVLAFVALTSSGQQFGGNPPWYKWRIIETDTVRIVYPMGLDSIAAQIAAISHHEARTTAHTIGHSLKPISIVLQDAPTYSNAFVQLAPRRSEFFLTPLQNNFSLGITPWHKTLAVHEYRHVMQFDNFNKGLAKVASAVLGQQGQLLIANAAVPGWFWEGEATFYETALTNNGRGRIPYFFNQYKSIWAANKQYSFMKLRNGSLKHFIPSDYHFGYNMVAYGLQKHGMDFWKKVTGDAVRFKGLFYPFSKAVERHSGQTYRDFQKAAFEYFKQASVLQPLLEANETLLANAEKNNVTDYYSPYLDEDSSVVVYVRQSKRVPAFYRIKGDKQKRIALADVMSDEYFDYKKGRILYAAFRPDKRWTYHTYSDIRIMDAYTGSRIQLTTKGRYFSPSFSNDGKTIVAVSVPRDQRVRLHLLDASTAEVKAEIPNPSKLFYTYPRFYKDSLIVSAVRDTTGKMAIAIINIADGSHSFITPVSHTVVSNPFVMGDTIVFNASKDNADNIFAVSVKDKQVYQLTGTTIGNYQPMARNGRLVYTKRTADGFLAASQPLSFKPLQENAYPGMFTLQNPYVPELLGKFEGSSIDGVRPLELPSRKYNELGGFMGFHSWRPYYEQPEFNFTIYGQNLLNTVQTELQYTYNENEGSHKIGINKLIGFWYPYITTGLSYTMNRAGRLNTGQVVNWDVFNANAGLIIPFILSAGRHQSALQVGSTFNYEKVGSVSMKNVTVRDINYLNSFISYRIQGQQAVQHILPRWALNTSLRYRNVVNLPGSATQLIGIASVNVPSFFRTHNITFSGAFQQINTNYNPVFSNALPFARGYSVVPYTRLLPLMYRGSAGYHAPIVYPDWGFANLVYFRRVRTQLFYDHAVATNFDNSLNFNFKSVGGELWFDTRLWNEFELSFGIRYSRLLDYEIAGATQPDRIEFMLPLTFL